MARAVDVVVFDVGGTLVDETRMWALWAEAIAVPPARLMAELEAVIAEGRHHRDVFTRLVPEFDRTRLDRENPYRMERGDLYPDAVPALEALVAAGFRVAVAANQPAATEAFLKESGLPLAFAFASEAAGVAKPDPAFFDLIADAAGVPPHRIAYVGDRVDNDVLPANAAGMVSVFLPRGPWGRLHATWPEAEQATVRLCDLSELVEALAH